MFGNEYTNGWNKLCALGIETNRTTKSRGEIYKAGIEGSDPIVHKYSRVPSDVAAFGVAMVVTQPIGAEVGVTPTSVAYEEGFVET